MAFMPTEVAKGHATTRVLLYLLSIICLIPTAGLACSSMTHIAIGHRSTEYLGLVSEGIDYRQLILKHQDAFQAGCPYPDAYYPGLCFDGYYHDVSEDTHWVPFLNASVNYIRKTYPKPWGEHVEKLVVFILGVVTHSVADVNWHSLGIDQGFLQVMGKVNYHGSFGDAHSDGDFGGDVLNLFEQDMDYIGRVDKWWVPTDDLLNIYTELYGNPDRMNSTVVEECTNWLFLGRLGENLGVIDLLYPLYAERSPFIVDRLNDYYLGGMDDMAAWTDNVWGHTVTMLDQGTSACDLPNNPIYIECNSLSGTGQGRGKRSLDPKPRNPGMSSDRLELSLLRVDNADMVVKYQKDATVFTASKSYKRRLRKLMRQRRRVETATEFDSDVIEPEVFYDTRISYSRLGESMVTGDLNGDGFTDLVIAAPGYSSLGNYQQGRVYIVYGSASGLPMTNLTVESEPGVDQRTGLTANGRFGTSLAVVDLNADGFPDLAVGAPSTGSDQLNYNGQVYVYYGSAFGLAVDPSVTISCTERYCNLGWSLAAVDLNQDGALDLVVGAPFAPSGGEQRGLVGVLYSTTAPRGNSLTEADFDWRGNGEQDYGWFGFSVTGGGGTPGSAWVTVGAPTFRLCSLPNCAFSDDDVQAVGKVYTFETPLTSVPASTRTGDQAFAQLGATVASHSSVGLQYHGMVASTYSMPPVTDNTTDTLQVGLVSLFEGHEDAVPQYTFSGDREFDRFGQILQFASISGESRPDVIITAPFRSESVTTGREAGRVYIFLQTNGAPSGHYTTDEADLTLGSAEARARFGYSLATMETATSSVQVAVSAPHSYAGARMAGRVGIYSF